MNWKNVWKTCFWHPHRSNGTDTWNLALVFVSLFIDFPIYSRGYLFSLYFLIIIMGSIVATSEFRQWISTYLFYCYYMWKSLVCTSRANVCLGPSLCLRDPTSLWSSRWPWRWILNQIRWLALGQRNEW